MPPELLPGQSYIFSMNELKEEVAVWKRKHNRQADRMDKLKSEINDLRMRLEDAEKYIEQLKKHILIVTGWSEEDAWLPRPLSSLEH